MLDRRTFLKTLAATAAIAPAARAAGQSAPASATQFSTTIHKSILISMLPKDKTYAERFAMAREVGFEGIEMQTITVLRQLPRKIRIIRPVRNAAVTASRTTPPPW